MSAWQENSKSETGKSEASQALLFAALFEAALSGKNGLGEGSDLGLEALSGQGLGLTGSQPLREMGYNLSGMGASSYLDKTPTSSQGKNQEKPELEQLIAEVGQRYGVDPNLIRQVVIAESGFNVQAVSHAGAKGLMQLMPGTVHSYGVDDPFDPVQNLDGGTHFLRDLLNRFNGNVSLALAGYNAGPGAVDKYKGIPPYQETQNYVQKILGGMGKFDEQA